MLKEKRINALVIGLVACCAVFLMVTAGLAGTAWAGEESTKGETFIVATNTDTTVEQHFNLLIGGSGEDGAYVDDDYTDVNKVKIEWTITNITVVCDTEKTWDAEGLRWNTDRKNYQASGGTAQVTLTNYGSVAMTVTPGFTAPEGDLAATFKDVTFTQQESAISDFVLSTPVEKSITKTYTDADFVALAQTYAGTISVDAAAFSTIENYNNFEQYGRFTITLTTAE